MLIGDFNVIPTDQDVYKPERWAKDALFSPQARAKFAELVGAGLDRRDPHAAPGRANLHLLALLAELVRARRRHPHRPFAAQPAARKKAESGRRRPRAARLGEDQRPRADVDRAEGLIGFPKKIGVEQASRCHAWYEAWPL